MCSHVNSSFNSAAVEKKQKKNNVAQKHKLNIPQDSLNSSEGGKITTYNISTTLWKGFNVNCSVFQVDYWIKDSVKKWKLRLTNVHKLTFKKKKYFVIEDKTGEQYFLKIEAKWGGGQCVETKMIAQACNVS